MTTCEKSCPKSELEGRIKEKERLAGSVDASVPTKKSVLIEAIESVRLRRAGCQRHVYPFRIPAFLRTYVLPTSASSAS
jgi:hypothetical protein